MKRQAGLLFGAEVPPAPRAGDYLCTHCWTDSALSDAHEHFSCRTCNRRDRLVPKRPHELHGLDVRCPRPPAGWLRCPDEVAAACPGCSVYKAFVDGVSARVTEENVSRQTRQAAMRYVDFVRPERDDLTSRGAAIRLWERSGYDGGWAQLADMDLDAVKIEFRRLPLTCAQVWAGELAPVPEVAR
jgi:DNA-directed RNA polymerase subunit RPC12/RpoP